LVSGVKKCLSSKQVLRSKYSFIPHHPAVNFATFSVFEDTKAAMVGGLKNGEQEMIWKKDAWRFVEERSGDGDRLR
jgi:hypothetical protein